MKSKKCTEKAAQYTRKIERLEDKTVNIPTAIKKSKVLLISLPGHNTGNEPLFPLGIGYLVSSLRADRPVQAVHYQRIEHAKKQLPEIIERYAPGIVGLTCTTFNRGNVRSVCQWLRSNHPEIRIVLGGVHVSFMYEQALIDYGADYVVIGEGELTLRELCIALDNNKPLTEIKGIAYREGDRVLKNPPRVVIQNLDDLPMPDYSFAGDIMRKSGMGFVISSRGCPVRCTFCSTSGYWGQKVRTNSPKRIVDEIENLVSVYGVKKIFFHDDDFNLGIKRVSDICNEITSRGLMIEWAVACRVHPVSAEMIDMMVAAGCRHICWGIESGSPDMLAHINKKITLEQITNAYELCRKHLGLISVGAFTMVGNPGENKATIAESISFLNTLPLTDPPSTSILNVLPGSKLYGDLLMKHPEMERFWADSDDLIFYTEEHSQTQLQQWANMISQSGALVDFDRGRHFWNNVLFGNIPAPEAPKLSFLSSDLDQIIPPEIKDDEFYHLILKLTKEEKLKTVLEIGSSAGGGSSTEAFVKGLRENSGRPNLFCMEISKPRFKELKKRYAGYSFVKCYNVSSVSLDKFPSEKDLAGFFYSTKTGLNAYPLERVVGWLRQDIEYVKSSGVSVSGIQQIKDENDIHNFDMVLIDGSEFTGKAELNEIYGAKYILLDDINGFKNYENYRRLAADPDYDLIAENWKIRNGYAVFKKNETALPIHGSAQSATAYEFDSEQKEQALVRQLIQPGMTVLDVGANVGEYTKLFSLLVGDAGKVFAYEPDPDSARSVEDMASRDNLTNVVLVKQAVCEFTGKTILNRFPTKYSAWNSLGRPHMENPQNLKEFVPIVDSVEVETVTLDGFCRAHGISQIDYLKLDVEGAEFRALQGTCELLAKRAIRYLQFEISRKMLEGLNTSARPVFDLLAAHGYECHAITADGRIGDVVTDSSAFYENYIAVPGQMVIQQGPVADTLSIHFFTIVLNGEPFIRHHIEVFRQLPFPWHWHIVEGVADLKHDTGWSLQFGGKITDDLHCNGLSNDGTTEYLNDLAKQFPENITIYRKPKSAFWDGKREMVNAPLVYIHEDCLLWQVDSDELWTTKNINALRDLFMQNPDRTAAFFYCDYFVGSRKYVSSLNTWATYPKDWIRVWNFKPGMLWAAHEPPILIDQNGRNIGDLAPFSRDETMHSGITFQHVAYVIESQVRFKEIYYGYKNAVLHWRKLQNTNGPINPAAYLPWAKNDAIVDDWPDEKGALLADPLLAKEYRLKEYVSMSVDGATLFEEKLRILFKDIRPATIIETGTFQGRGTSSIIWRALRDFSINADFTTIEVNPSHYAQAQYYFKQQGMGIHAELGLSLPRHMLPDKEEITEKFIRNREYDNIYYDHSETDRARLYFAETNFDVPDNLLYKTMERYGFKPAFVLLDSAGHLGFAEFTYFLSLIQGDCFLMLDDIYHCKHYKTLQVIKADPRFKILVESYEKFGFCIVKYTHCRSILYLRPDSIGDNILAASMLPHIKAEYPDAKISILCQQHIADLYEASPFIDAVIGFDRQKGYQDEEYRNSIIQRLQASHFDLALNSLYSRDPLYDVFTINSGAQTSVAFNGNLCNIPVDVRDRNNTFYTKVIPDDGEHKPELQRHHDFLSAIGIEAPELKPIVWITPDDEKYADDFFKINQLESEKTIALFVCGQHVLKFYEHYTSALSISLRDKEMQVVALGSISDREINQKIIEDLGVKAINLTGKTTLRQTAAILKRCRLGIGADTGTAHIACAVGTPNVVILGGGHFGRFMPYSPLTSIVCLPLDCYYCNWRCKYSRVHCVKDINLEVMTEAIKQTLEKSSDKPRIFVQGYSLWEQKPGYPQWQSFHNYLNVADVDIIPVGEINPETSDLWNKLRSMDRTAQTNFLKGAAAELIRRGEKLFSDNDFKGAESSFSRALELQNNFPEAMNKLGRLYHKLGKKEKALWNLEAAVKNQPNNADFLKNLAHFYHAVMGRTKDAIEIYGKALKAQPEDIESLIALGQIAIQAKDLKAVKAIFSRILDLDPKNVEIQNFLDSINTRDTAGEPSFHEAEKVGGTSTLDATVSSNKNTGPCEDKEHSKQQFIQSPFMDNDAIAAYFQPASENTNKNISVKPLRIMGNTYSSYESLKHYEIKDFGNGFPAAESILWHILSNKVGRKFSPTGNFWLTVIGINIECEISSAAGGYFDELKPDTLEDISPDLARGETKERKAIIYSYKELMASGLDMGRPLYVSGAVLNKAGAAVEPKAIYMMDGALRITAAALCHQRNITIRLLILEDEYPQLLCKAPLVKIHEEIGSLSWFDKHQSIPLVGIKGERTLKRFELIDMSLLRDQVVMDFGCNIGHASLKAVLAGARQVIGIEGMPSTHQLAVDINKLAGFDNLTYLNIDFNDKQFDEAIDKIFPAPADYSFFFSVYRTKELTQRDKLFSYIIKKTRKGIFFEGHAHPKIDTLEYYNWLFESFGLKYNFLGNSEGRLRPLFFLPCGISKKGVVPPDVKQITNGSLIDGQESIGKTNIVLAVNLVPTDDHNWRHRQQLCIESIDKVRSLNIVPLNICYENEIITPEQWNVLPALKQSANVKLKVEGKRKPFVNEIFNLASEWAEQNGAEWFAYANNDIIITPELVKTVFKLINEGAETIIVSRNELDSFNKASENIPGYLEYCGFDVFFCNVGWWLRNKIRFHPYILGERAWDDAYASIMMFHSKGKILYINGLCLHIKHPTNWLEGVYASYNMSIYNGVDRGYRDAFNAFVDAVGKIGTEKLTTEMYDDLAGRHFGRPINKYVNICMVTYNRIEFTRQSIDALIEHTDFPYILTVVDNNSQDGTKEYLQELKTKGIIKNLILLDKNVGVAKASNLAWSMEPEAEYYLKLDNDIVIKKKMWLSDMVRVVEGIPKAGAVAYNFEPVSFPLVSLGSLRVRIKNQGNLGGACILIPKRTESILGYWCEDYGLYSEEDADYGSRILLAGLMNIYMEDENIGIHLPAGKAAIIDLVTFSAKDGVEEKVDEEYRIWKDEQRRKNTAIGGIFTRNFEAYRSGLRPLYIGSSFVETYYKKDEKESIVTGCNKLKIGFLSLGPHSSACPYIRLHSPLTSLQMNGSIELFQLSHIVENNFHLNLESLAKCDIIIVQRDFAALMPYEELIKCIDRSRQKIVFELDDAIAKIQPSHINYESCRKISPLINAYIMKADLVTVSTERLKTYYNNLNNNIVVIPNSLDIQLWGNVTHHDIAPSPVRILFSGTLTHSDDLRMIEDVIEKVLKEFDDNVMFLFWGNTVEQLRHYPQVKVLAEFTPDYATYAKILSSTPIDFAIIPLEDNAFNQAKSHIKWLEYSACGIPGIYSNVGEYCTSIKDNETGILVNNNADQWHKAIQDLILDKAKRERIADAAYKEVLAEHTIEKNSHLWMQAYNNILGSSDIGNVHYSALPKTKVTIIIPVFNKLEFTKKCIDAISCNTPSGLYELIIVDNGSTDATKEYLHSLDGKLKVIHNDMNLGFSKACNQGARSAASEYLVFLNNDTIPHKNWLTELIDVADAWKDVGIVGSRLLFPDNTIQHAGVAMLPVLSHLYSHSPSAFLPANKPRDLNVVTAACMLIRKDIFFTAGAFHEGYVNGCEDIDLCLSVRATGKRVFYNPRSMLTHFEGQSIGREDKMDENRKLLFERWRDRMPSDYEKYLFDDGFRRSPIDQTKREYHEDLCKRIISIIIVTYNSLSDIGRCLSSIQAGTNLPYEVFIIDNNSTDGTKDCLRDLKGVHVIINDENIGFSKACNQGIQRASGEYIVLLNPDTAVTTDWAWRMLLHFKNGVGAVGPVSNYVAGLQKHELYRKSNLEKADINEIAKNFYAWNKNHSVETKLLIGFCMMIKRSVMDDIGLLDEDFFLGIEDLEYSWRLGQKGYKLAVATDVFIFHQGQKSFSTVLPEKNCRITQECQDKLYEKLEAYYGKGQVPSSQELWGMDWFKPSQLTRSPVTSIIILCFNQIEYTKRCLQSIEKNTSVPYELILVDNGSTDGTRAFLKEYANIDSKCTLILNEDNRGFAGGNNQGIAAAKGDYALLLNNNVVVTKHWLNHLFSHLEKHPDVGMAGPMSNAVSGPQQVQEALYGKNMTAMQKFARNFAARNSGKITESMRLEGFCLLIKKAVIDVIGGLDERDIMKGFEIDDLCLRSSIADYKNVIARDVFIHNNASMPFNGNAVDCQLTMQDNRRHFADKWKDIVEFNGNGYSIHLTKEQQRAKLVEWGEERLSNGDARAAAKIFERVFRLVRTDFEALNNLGVIQWQIGEAVSAINTFQTALSLNPKDSGVLANLLQAATEAGRFDLIKPTLPEIVKQAQPANPDIAKLIDAQRI